MNPVLQPGDVVTADNRHYHLQRFDDKKKVWYGWDIETQKVEVVPDGAIWVSHNGDYFEGEL